MRIEFNKWCVGNRLNRDLIVVHPELIRHPKLFNHVVEHEASHDTGKILKDFYIDLRHLTDSGHMLIDYLSFMLSHPSSMAQSLPCFYHNKKVYWDVLLLFLHAISWIILTYSLWRLAL